MKLEIKKHRTRLGLSRKKLADELEINEGSLTTYEAGRTPPLKTILKMCDRFGVDLKDFVGLTDMTHRQRIEHAKNAYNEMVLSYENEIKNIKSDLISKIKTDIAAIEQTSNPDELLVDIIHLLKSLN